MRRDMQEIIPGLFLGPYAAAMKSKKACLQQHNITHIVCIRQSIEANFIRPNFPDLFRYLVLDIADVSTENIIQYIPQVRDFIDSCYDCGGKVLVHGNAGISRSATLVIGYIMEKYGLSYKNAYVYVQQRRFCINPNEGFSQQLIEYEPIYRARQCLDITDTTHTTGSMKRKCQFDTDDNKHSDSSMIT
ncbi:serine/threonine/tyrosine-interacting protein-like isoform X2 [Mercenaria mercenaria]|nr:serine/threonine/tyrosine-interacting protein-like isoform X2 [Mercenaria mercenaria]